MSVSTRVFVLNQRGQPLMPTYPRKARILLKTGKAKIKTHNPFLIQLTYQTGENKQRAKLGNDLGFKHAAGSVATVKSLLFLGELDLDQGVSKRIQQRANARRSRRSRLWYRKPRFLNRKNRKGKSPPSTEHRAQTQINFIKKAQTFIPITDIIFEVNTFDIQKLENPNIKGVEYQQGTLQGYEIREYLLKKYNHACVYCGAKNVPLQVEHVTPKSRGGSNRVSNLVMSCADCNQRKSNQTAAEFGYPEIQAQVGKSYRAPTQMNAIVKRVIEADYGLNVTVSTIPSYEVAYKRTQLGLEKSHINDALVVSGGPTYDLLEPCRIKQTRRNNRKIQINNRRYGIAIRKQRPQISRNDLIEYHVRGEPKPRLFRVGSTSGPKKLKIWDAKFEQFREPSILKVRLISYGKGLCFIKCIIVKVGEAA